VLLGEWGEGKTDAFSRYIAPISRSAGDIPYFVSASTLANSFERQDVKRLIETSSLSAVRFLVALFNAVREEDERAVIPNPKDFQVATDFLRSCLKKTETESRRKSIFVFIDEFEELLLLPARLNEIVSGVKECINGRFPDIDENGQHEGRLHFFVAATPDAYYRLQVNEDTSLIFGGLGRRAGTIELPQIKKAEGIEFLESLVRYCYLGKVPTPAPVNGVGILTTLFRIAQGNPGNMVSLFARLMTSARLEGDRLSIIDHEMLLAFLSTEQVFVYGGATPCIEVENLNRFLKIVGDQRDSETGKRCQKLLTRAISEYRPYSIEELDSWLGVSSYNISNIINVDLRPRTGIEKSILKVCPIKHGKDREDVISAMQEFIVTDREKKFLKIDNYLENFDDLLERLTFFEQKDAPRPLIFLPSERSSIVALFEGITVDRARELENIFVKKLCTEQEYLIVSEDLLSQIFPSPVPKELEFLKNRELRMKLWREVTRNLSEYFDLYALKSLFSILGNAGVLSTTSLDYVGDRAAKSQVIFQNIPLSILTYVINGEIKAEDISIISQIVRGTRPPIHCVVAVSTGDITPQAEEKIDSKELGKSGDNLLLHIRLHPTLAKRIIAIYRADFEAAVTEISPTTKQAIIRRITEQELGVSQKVEQWLHEQTQRGLVVPRLPLKSTSSLTEFSDASKFFINFMGDNLEPQEAYDKNRDILARFIFFESKGVGLIPDITLPKLSAIAQELADFAILQKNGGKYSIATHPIEKKISGILSREKKIKEDELEAFFVHLQPRVFKDVFLHISEYKGSIARDASGYLVVKDETELDQRIRELERELRRLADTESAKRFGYAYVSKLKGEPRFIRLEEFLSFIEKMGRLEHSVSEEVRVERLLLEERLIQHFTENLFPLFRSAFESANEKVSEASLQIGKFEKDLRIVSDGCNKWFKLEFDVPKVKEFKKARQLKDSVDKTFDFDAKAVAELVKTFGSNEETLFSFRNKDSDSFYFNPKLFQIQKKLAELNSEIERRSIDLTKLVAFFIELEEKRLSVTSHLTRVKPDASSLLCSKIVAVLQQLAMDIIPKVKPVLVETISLEQIKEARDQNRQDTLLNIENLGRCLSIVEDSLIDEEKLFAASKSNAEQLLSRAKAVFGTEVNVEPPADELQKALEKYRALPHDIVPDDSAMFLEQVRSLRPRLNLIGREINAISESIGALWSGRRRDFRDSIRSIDLIITAIGNHYPNVLEMKDMTTTFSEMIEPDSLLRVQSSVSETSRYLESIRETLIDSVKGSLDPSELTILGILVSGTNSGESWVSVDEVKDLAIRKYGLSEQNTIQAMDSLLEKRLLRRGISIGGG